ncbi:motility associated factor glycosyltransferase family protein [Seleniivibrio woodruffii]|uniref:motility associated factor glycosyltransferase family protein n=1 Tax=Seleniivibrio woodruffii TaxID=1078050 RepID=UPI0016450BC2|nr:6-hydroxymethylpterin diphosphokinase MptE-like protein [Seleniivibrio woodruffii]
MGEELPVIFTTINNVLTATDTKFYVKTVNFIEQAVAFSENKEYYLNVVRATKDAIKEVLNFFGNDPHDSMIGIENTLLNIDEILNNPGIDQLKGAFKGRPGIVVATGPSLNKNVELLRDVTDKAVVVGADASMRVLAKKGMKPHMVCSLERMPPTAKLFEELSPEAFEDVYYAAAPVISPITYQTYKGKRIIVYRNFATFKWLDIEKGTLNIGPSSGNMAFKILEYIGCDPIILIGQDLAFGEDGNTHATGSTFGERESTYYENCLLVEGNYSPQVRSSRVWNMFLNYYHKDVLNSQAKVINATEGGAKIHGTEIMTFKEAIGKYVTESFDPLAAIKKTLTYPDGETLTAQRKQVLDKVDQGLMTCGKSIELFKGCHALCMEYIEKVWIPFSQGQPYNEAEGNRIVTELEQSVQIFRDPDFFNVLMHYVQSYAIKTMIEVHDITARDLPVHEIQVNVVSILKDMYEVMIQLIIKMEELLKVLKEKLEAELISG